MVYTISTHNGHQVARQHNLRNRKVTDKESHIMREGIHETWLDVRPEEAYHRLFDAAIIEYNAHQVSVGHSERQIHDYYKKICDDSKKHAVYEMIIAIGNYDNHPTEELSRSILNEFVRTWAKRNPNLVMIGAYYHGDEEGTGHCHIDYIPVTRIVSRGPRIQTGLVKALNEMGYETENIHETAQIKWEREQNQYLERLCVREGLQIEHPMLENVKHMNIKEFKQQKRIEELERENEQMAKKINELIDEHNHLVDDIIGLNDGRLDLALEIVEKSRVERDREELSR
ncbi:MAG: plasmid recombination protein [Lachnospiraceae bacterium]|nr:plasmid recombination protein [Lachnospiraceae bacterium]